MPRPSQFCGIVIYMYRGDHRPPHFHAIFQVTVDVVAGTVCWLNGVDLDPDVLHVDHAPASGRPPVLLKEYRLRPTG